MPTLEQWKRMTPAQREREIDDWSPYLGEGELLVREIAEDFEATFSHLHGLRVDGVGIFHGGCWCIDVSTPFIFDRRLVPPNYLGIFVHRAMDPDVFPREFQEAMFSRQLVGPKLYENFVDRHAGEIRKVLGNQQMSREDMLSALLGSPFQEFVKLREKADRPTLEEYNVDNYDEWGKPK